MSKLLSIAENNFLKITFGAIVFVMSLVFGFSAWLTNMNNMTYANAENIRSVKQENISTRDVLINIDKRLARIEIMLETTKQGDK